MDGVTIDHASFVMASIGQKSFRKSKLVGVDSSEADLTGCNFTDTVFEDCGIENAVVSAKTIFAGADLRGARLSNLRLDVTKARGAVVSPSQAEGFCMTGSG